MISLKSYADDRFISSYVKDKIKKINNRYLKLPLEHKLYLINKFSNAFNEESINKNFFEQLLSLNIRSVIQRFEFIELYYNIAFFASLNIVDIVSGMDINESNKVKSEYLDKYIDVCLRFKQKTLLKEFKSIQKIEGDIRKVVVENSDVFQKFQKFVKEEILSSKDLDDGVLRFGIWEQILDYKSMVSAKEKMEIVKTLGVIVCPYCNRSYISNFDDNWKHEERTSADLDHFYPSGSFKLFELSLYNFVPSCKMCNSLFKGKRNMDIMNPYEEAYEEAAVFKLVNEDFKEEVDDIYGWSRGNILDIECLDNVEIEKKFMIEREIKLFRIREVYQVHNEYAETLRFKRNVLGNRIRSDIRELIGHETDAKISESELDKLFYGVDFANIHKEYLRVPLSKMIYDILGD